ncbi:endonuclease MutS2 [Mesobacillus selenatarsenatis]|uniref:Recombination inhibitory protein MutS2 n=1 Tax=Mesobacillus selenatarsenatis (strain DSM 18680 / JCM 14380 / FERM P-15431 / SF-1) TaxID=1321606 RepID=A0A0A8X482_MESS1|nr:DNA mismatch repair protein [Mesobacillus selenatarsenatis]GAM14079.1 recombination inhibitory protein MutS2 [Mesobacillus selenatarsenatis SF-1]
MNEQTFTVLGYDKIKEEIAGFALTESGRIKAREMQPSINMQQITSWQEEVSEAIEILRISSSVPIHGLEGMEMVLKGFNKGIPLRTEQLMQLLSFLETCNKIRRFMKDKEYVAPRVSAYVFAIEELPELAAEIQRCIRNGQIDDYATRELLKVRKQIGIQEDRLKEKLNQLLKSAKIKPFLQEAVISQRNGRYVVPVKKEYRGKLRGAVLDTSASGSTLFVEPEEIGSFQDQMEWLYLEEQAEVEKVLFALTGLAEGKEKEIRMAMETMVHYDYLFSKAKYCRSIDGKRVEIHPEPIILFNDARHPLLGEKAVPLTIEIGKDYHALVITGPNTGGKTVSIKTAGLLSLMAQSGLLLPVEDGSESGIFHKVLVDIGDGQSIEQNLSTFSSRIVNIIEILKETNDKTLVLLDELGSGTDPGEGMGLATAILENLNNKGATIFATTHYSEIKDFADNHEDFMNGSMEFDIETLKPTYRLRIGKGGESQAFAIALKLGIHPKLIERAHNITYKSENDYTALFANDPAELKAREQQIIANKHKRKKSSTVAKQPVKRFEMGDSVHVLSSGELGVIFKGPDSQGNYLVQVRDRKIDVNYKRLKLNLPASELYPEDYDFSIIFESKEHRKLLNQMSKKHIEERVIRDDT